jgi:hypothetical protein
MDINLLSNGMNQDSGNKFRPNSSWSFALNAINVSRDGDKGSLINEEGNTICSNLPTNYYIIGHAESNSDLVYLFLTDNTTSIIASIDNNCTYTEIIKSTCLGFKDFNPISAIFKEIDGCEPALYWANDADADKHVNLYELYSYIDLDALNAAYFAAQGVPIPRNLPENFYVQQSNIYDTWNCNKFKQVKDIKIPKIQFSKTLDFGGQLKAGAYQVVIRYVDADDNRTEFFDPTSPVPIIDDAYKSPYVCIDGCVSDTDTNKSLEYVVSNLDQTYPYYEVGVVITQQNIQSAYIESRLSTSANQFTVSGSWEQTLDIAEINIPTAKWITSKGLTQHQNRLVKYGVKERDIDHTAFTRKALDIQSRYIISHVLHEDKIQGIKTPDYYSNRRGYMRDEVYAFAIQWLFKDGSVTPAYHIPGRQKNKRADGTFIAPLYFINTNAGIPLPPNRWDSTTYEDASAFPGWSFEDAEHLFDLGYTSAEIERWMVYNTAVPDETPLEDVEGSGELGYYECNTYTYPSMRSCSGTKVFEELADTPVRYHRMPDATLEPIYINDSGNIFTRSLGMEFSGCEPPAEYADEIQGYYILRSLVTEENKSIISKGIMWNYNIIVDDYIATQGVLGNPLVNYWNIEKYDSGILGGISDTPTNYNQFWSNETTFVREDISKGNIIKFENEIRTPKPVSYLGSCIPFFAEKYYIAEFTNACITTHLGQTNRIIDNSGYIPHNSTIEGTSFTNNVANIRSNSMYLLEFDDTHKPLYPILGGTDALGSNSATAYYVSSKRFLGDQYGDITNLTYYKCTNIQLATDPGYGFCRIFGGDTFVTQLNFRRFRGTNDGDSTLNYFEFDWSEFSPCSERNDLISISRYGSLTRVFVESRINSDLRHTQSESQTIGLSESEYTFDCGQYLPNSVCNKEAYSGKDLFTSGIALPWQCDNHFKYNTDYSTEQLLQPQFPLYFTFDYCSDCQSAYPYRFVWSEASFGREKADNFLVILANSFKDIPQRKGTITTSFIKNHQLYFLSSQALWFQPTNDQNIQTNEGIVYVGGGEFGQLNPQEVISTKHGYAGSVSQWAIEETEQGVFWPDINQGKVFQLSEGLNSISEIGMETWFMEKMKNYFASSWLSFAGKPYPLADRPQSLNGIGALITYDPRYKRIILTYKDWIITPRAQALIEQGNLIYNEETQQFELLVPDLLMGIPDDGSVGIDNPILPDPPTGGSNPAVINPGGPVRPESEDGKTESGISNVVSKTPQAFGTKVYLKFDIHEAQHYFQNVSFTISYSLQSNTWISFHSYIPSYMFNTNKFFFTSDLNGLWKHGERNFQTYYGTKYDHILEYTSTNNFMTKVYNSFQYVSEVQDYNELNRNWVDKFDFTFDNVVVYNDTQSSGKLNLIVAEDSYVEELLYNINDVPVFKHDKTWKFNKIRNLVVDESVPLFLKNYTSIVPEYFIDKIPNTAATNTNKSVYEQDKIRAKYCNIRLFFNPLNDYRIVTDVLGTLNTDSIR